MPVYSTLKSKICKDSIWCINISANSCILTSTNQICVSANGAAHWYCLDMLFVVLSHYENTPMQHTAIFHGCKNDNFQLNLFYYFHIFAQNIDCGYTLEPPQ